MTKYLIDNIQVRHQRTDKNANGCNTNLRGIDLSSNNIPKMTPFWRFVRQFRENLKIWVKKTKYLIDNIQAIHQRTYKNTNGCNTNLRGIDLTQIKFQRWRHFVRCVRQFREILIISAKKTKYLIDNTQAIHKELKKTQTDVIQTLELLI